MSVEKTEAIILAVLPYRETSCILRLFTETHGLIQGIAKGVRKDTRSAPVDRGILVDVLVYHKPNRDLHTLGKLQPVDFFPGIRECLNRSAIRDTALELFLKSVTQTGHGHELYRLLLSFLKNLQNTGKNLIFPLLWHFFHEYSSLAGFRIQKNRCPGCAKDTQQTGGVLQIARGALICPDCARSGNSRAFLNPEQIRLLDQVETDHRGCNDMKECLRVTGLLLSYCRYHLDIRSPLNSLNFMETMLDM
ncbi:MAG: DNA repair protein RecO [Chitinispirillaceae bacterium]